MLNRLNILKRIVKEATNIVAWQVDINTALHNIDATWVVSGVLALARIPHHHTTHEPGGVDEVTGVTPGAHAATHQNGGSDEINVAGLSGELADNQPPKAHKDSHDPEDGSDKLDTAIPVKVGAANAMGSSHSLARADHVHEREHVKYTDAEVEAVIATKLKAGSVTDTTTVAGLISVTFAEAFASTPVVIVQIENDVDYYCVITAKDAAGFTVKVLKTAHAHSNPNTSAISAGTPAGSIGAGSAHHHSNPNTSAVSGGTPAGSISSVSAGTPSGSIGAEAAHTHGIGFASGAGSSHRHSNPYTGYESSHIHSFSVTSGAGSAHKHSQGVTTGPSAIAGGWMGIFVTGTIYVALVSGGSPTKQVVDAPRGASAYNFPSQTHTHTNPDTATESSHTHSVSGTSGAGSSHRHSQGNTGSESAHTHTVSGTSGAGSSHNHTFTGSALGTHNHTFTGSALATHSHTQGDTGDESAHTHVFTGNALGTHSHTIANTDSANAGNALASTAVTFSYIAMVP